MEIVRTNLSTKDRIDFVQTVSDLVKIDGKYIPALYDFAFRSTMLVYIADQSFDGMSSDEVSEIVFSDEAEKIIMDKRISPVVSALNSACKEQIKIDHAEWMVAFKNAVTPNPVEGVVAILEDFAKNVQEAITDKDVLDKIVNQLPKQQIPKKRKTATVKSK